MFQPLKLRGSVRTLRTELAEWDITKEQWHAPRRSSVAQLRPDGRVDEQEDHNPNGSVSRSRHSYDEIGRLLESTFQLDDGPISKNVYRYDGSGRIAQNIRIDREGIEREAEIYSYGPDGRKTKLQFVPKLENSTACSTMYGVEGAQQGYGAEGVTTITTLYDDHGESSEAIFRNDRGALILRVVLTRDGAGRLLKEESRCGDHAPFPFGEVLENAPPEDRAVAEAILEKLFSPHKAMWGTTYDYDDRGRQIRRITTMAGISEDHTTWDYDEHDNPIREIEKRTSGELRADESGNLQTMNQKSFKHEVRFDYKYDSHGNWTERVVSVRYEANPDFQRSNIERRGIRYYPI
jgi:hypothetical protein